MFGRLVSAPLESKGQVSGRQYEIAVKRSLPGVAVILKMCGIIATFLQRPL
jgi:hypothetical protein